MAGKTLFSAAFAALVSCFVLCASPTSVVAQDPPPKDSNKSEGNEEKDEDEEKIPDKVTIGANIVLEYLDPSERGDARTHLQHYGVNPTVVVNAYLLVDDKSRVDLKDATRLKKLLKTIDDKAEELAKKGVDTLVIYNHDFSKPDTQLAVFKRSGLKHASSAMIRTFAWSALGQEERNDLTVLHAENTRQVREPAQVQWALLGEPGVVTTRGMVFGGKVFDAAISAVQRNEKDEQLANTLQQIGRFEFSEAWATIVDEESKLDDDQKKHLTTAWKDSLAHYRKVSVTPLIDAGYVLHAIDELKNLMKLVKQAPAEGEIDAEVKELKGSDAAKAASKGRKDYDKLRAALDGAEGKFRLPSADNDGTAYMKGMIKVLEVPEESMKTFLKKYGDSVYAGEVRTWQTKLASRLGQLRKWVAMTGGNRGGR